MGNLSGAGLTRNDATDAVVARHTTYRGGKPIGSCFPTGDGAASDRPSLSLLSTSAVLRSDAVEDARQIRPIGFDVRCGCVGWSANADEGELRVAERDRQEVRATKAFFRVRDTGGP